MSLLGLGPLRRPRFSLASVAGEELVLGAFQRARSAIAPGFLPELARTRRLSGGPALLAGPGTLHLTLALPSADALVEGGPHKIVNRYVRPLLRALGRLGAPARYVGRDWVSVGQRPVAWVGFAHHAGTGAAFFEAFLAVDHPFALPPEADGYPARRNRPFFDLRPATLRELRGESLTMETVGDRVWQAYEKAHGAALDRAPFAEAELRPPDPDDRSPFGALEEEAIGFVGAIGGPSPELGGDLMASEDLMLALGAALAPLGPSASEDEVTQALGEAIGRTGGVIDGLRDQFSLARVAARALALAP